MHVRVGVLGRRAPALHPLQVFQRREDGSVNFFRGWEAYRDGFGKLTGEHWLGKSHDPTPRVGDQGLPGPHTPEPAPRCEG